MSPLSRHRCLIYKGPLTPYLPGTSAIIRQKLTENYRCLYLDGPSRVAGTHSYLIAAGIDVTKEVAKGSLVLSSDNTHLMEGRFNVDRMLGMLEQALNQALRDGYQGLWTTGDMSMEFGPKKDFPTLLDMNGGWKNFCRHIPRFAASANIMRIPCPVTRCGMVY